ncbi:hypothetical protein VNO78_06393 [Psophocarpus tetragonolobus]|uniref:Bet v I/Major latex protein domain-containing protein n=1 Tax=Psophocarpus tetragonolobus TaxID=3891 RepID=A0AAN9SV12_PSOTE
MMKELNGKIEVSIGLEALWQAWAKDMIVTIPKVMPNVVKDVKVIEGDGGVGSILLFTFFSDMTPISSKKETITDLDENSHEFGYQVLEGGYLENGYSCYKINFKLSAIEEHKTLINVKITYDCKSDIEESTPPLKTLESTLFYIGCLETYLLNCALLQDNQGCGINYEG